MHVKLGLSNKCLEIIWERSGKHSLEKIYGIFWPDDQWLLEDAGSCLDEIGSKQVVHRKLPCDSFGHQQITATTSRMHARQWIVCRYSLINPQLVLKLWKVWHKPEIGNLQNKACTFWNVLVVMVRHKLYFEGEHARFLFLSHFYKFHYSLESVPTS